MITDVDDTLRELLLKGLPLRKGEVEMTFNQPKREWSARLSRPALNLYLYDIRENTELRASEQVVRHDLPDGQVSLEHSLTRIDLCYLLTAWAKEAQDEHRLLSAALLTLLQKPFLPAELLPGPLKKLPMPLRVEVAQAETIKDIVDLWSSLDNEMHPAIRVKVTLSVEPFAPDIARTVSETEFRFRRPRRRRGQSEAGASAARESGEMAEAGKLLIVRGTISSEKYSLSVLKMVLKENGREVEIRDDGQFMISRLQEGEYHLEIRANERVIKQQKIKVPSPQYEVQV